MGTAPKMQAARLLTYQHILGKPPRAPSSALTQLRSFSVTPQEATSCCKDPTVSPGCPRNLLETLLSLFIPGQPEWGWILGWLQKPFLL